MPQLETASSSISKTKKIWSTLRVFSILTAKMLTCRRTEMLFSRNDLRAMMTIVSSPFPARKTTKLQLPSRSLKPRGHRPTRDTSQLQQEPPKTQTIERNSEVGSKKPGDLRGNQLEWVFLDPTSRAQRGAQLSVVRERRKAAERKVAVGRIRLQRELGRKWRRSP